MIPIEELKKQRKLLEEIEERKELEAKRKHSLRFWVWTVSFYICFWTCYYLWDVLELNINSWYSIPVVLTFAGPNLFFISKIVDNVGNMEFWDWDSE